MICHGTADAIVSIEQSHRLGRVWGKDFTLLAIEDGDHMFSDPEHFAEMVRVGVEFLK
jgi:surfactin synthase thioesterase subunit